jgi:hypothetical protein
VIAELDRYHGVVLRQLLVHFGRPVGFGIADLAGRVDAFSVESSAFQIKHSSKRLSPWRFTYLQENLDELKALSERFERTWIFLVCGVDGVVGMSIEEFNSIVQIGDGGAAWVRVKRSRNSMYRVGGVLGDLPHAKARGVAEFCELVLPATATAN